MSQGFPNKYDKSEVVLGDFIDQFCDHKDQCTAKCSRKSTKDIVHPADIAYNDDDHCPRFRSAEGGVVGADIIETGVWL